MQVNQLKTTDKAKPKKMKGTLHDIELTGQANGWHKTSQFDVNQYPITHCNN